MKNLNYLLLFTNPQELAYLAKAFCEYCKQSHEHCFMFYFPLYCWI